MSLSNIFETLTNLEGFRVFRDVAFFPSPFRMPAGSSIYSWVSSGSPTSISVLVGFASFTPGLACFVFPVISFRAESAITDAYALVYVVSSPTLRTLIYSPRQ